MEILKALRINVKFGRKRSPLLFDDLQDVPSSDRVARLIQLATIGILVENVRVLSHPNAYNGTAQESSHASIGPIKMHPKVIDHTEISEQEADELGELFGTPGP